MTYIAYVTYMLHHITLYYYTSYFTILYITTVYLTVGIRNLAAKCFSLAWQWPINGRGAGIPRDVPDPEVKTQRALLGTKQPGTSWINLELPAWNFLHGTS